MTKNRIIIRMILLVVVTIVFIGAFYFFFKNSRASSPLNDKEYMEQLSNLSKRYNVAGEPIITPTPIEIPKKNDDNPISSIIFSISNFFTGLLR